MTDKNQEKYEGVTPAPKKAEQARKYKKRLSALLLTTIAAGGVMSMLGWEAQAHGNKSGHSVPSSEDSSDSSDSNDEK
jgi:hypothetical protein